MEKPPIFVTQPSLPPLGELIPYLEQIWESKILTNSGPFHQRLEASLCEYLGVPYISLFSNATIALITALKALDVQGEVITTPYSFVATAHSLMWNGVKPVFVDIDPVTLNLDPNKIEAAITPQTTAIMPVHVYGQPCDVDAIEAIAKQHDLKVIYDAAHAFGVQCHCGSLLNHGDLSVLSFHATKVFNTFEGGAIVCQDIETKLYIDQLKNLLTLIYVQPMFQIIILTSRILAVSLMRDLRSQSSKYRCFLEQQMSPKINQVRQETKKYQSNKLLRMKEKSSKNDLEKISRALKKKIVEDSVSSKKKDLMQKTKMRNSKEF